MPSCSALFSTLAEKWSGSAPGVPVQLAASAAWQQIQCHIGGEGPGGLGTDQAGGRDGSRKWLTAPESAFPHGAVTVQGARNGGIWTYWWSLETKHVH